MLLLIFQAGDNTYGIDAQHIIEIIPVVKFRPIAHTHAAITGSMNYHGDMVPVVDLSLLLTGNASASLLSTRIILVQYRKPDGPPHTLGLLAEKATEMKKCDPEKARATGVTPPGSEYLGEIIIDDQNWVQCIEIEHLLPDELKDSLFVDMGAPAR